MLSVWCQLDLGLQGFLLFSPGVFFELLLDLFLGIGVKRPRYNLAPSVPIQESINDRVMEWIPDPLFKKLSNLSSADDLPFLSHINKRRYEFSFLLRRQMCVSSAPASRSLHYLRSKPIVIGDQIVNGPFSHPHMASYLSGLCRINGSMQNHQPFLCDPRRLRSPYPPPDLVLRNMFKCPCNSSHGPLHKDWGGLISYSAYEREMV